MATKEQITEYIDNQWTKGGNDAFVKYWEEPATEGFNATRLGLMCNWITPEIAVILEKLVGPTKLIKQIAINGSNN